MKTFLSNLIRQTARSIGRFFPTFCLTVLLFLDISLLVVWEPRDPVESILTRVAMTLVFGILLCTLGRLLYERYGWGQRVNRVVFDVGLVVLSGLAYPALLKVMDNQYVQAGYMGVMLALFALILFFADTQGLSRTFSHILKNSMVSLLACLIVYAGTSLCLYAFFSLIYEPADAYKAYSVNTYFIWIVLFFNLLLSAIPRKDTEFTFPKVFKVMICYVALPVYLLLIGILFIYLGKIVVTMSFPSGQINWFASVASLLFVFFILTLTHLKEDNKLARAFVRFGGFGLIPIIIMQFIAIYIRLSNYGLTAPRYVSLVLNILALVFAVVTLIKGGRFIKPLLLVAVAVSLVLTVTPLNVYDVPLREQTARLTRVLESNNMLVAGKVQPKEDIPQEDMIAITSTYEYISKHAMDTAKLPEPVKGASMDTFAATFGFDPWYEDSWRNEQNAKNESQWYSFQYDCDFLDTEEYNRVYFVSSSYHNASGIIWLLSPDGHLFSHDISKDIKGLYQEYKESPDNVPMEFDVEGGKLLLTRVQFKASPEGEISISSYDGFYLRQ